MKWTTTSMLLAFMIIAVSNTSVFANVDFEGVERTVKLYLFSVEKGLWESAFNNYLYHELRDQFMPHIPSLRAMEREMGPRRFEEVNVYWSEIARTDDGLYIAESHALYRLVLEESNAPAQEVALVFRLVHLGNAGWRIVSVSELPVEIAKSEMIVLARMEVEAIGLAIEMFRMMEGRYPTVREMEVSGEENILVKTGYLRNFGPDPWGNNYIYIPPQTSQGIPGMVWSTAGDINDRSSPGKPSPRVEEHRLYHILHPYND